MRDRPAIAERLLEAGYPLAIFNRTPGRDEELLGRGATRLEDPGQALVDADACLLRLADDDAVDDAVPSVLERAPSGTLQIFVGGTAELLAEGLLLGEAAGLDRKALLEVQERAGQAELVNRRR